MEKFNGTPNFCFIKNFFLEFYQQKAIAILVYEISAQNKKIYITNFSNISYLQTKPQIKK